MDYIPQSSIYVDVDAGVSILYRNEKNDVEAIGWTSPQQLKQDIADIENCRDRAKRKK
jgi:hypothetical protein